MEHFSLLFPLCSTFDVKLLYCASQSVLHSVPHSMSSTSLKLLSCFSHFFFPARITCYKWWCEVFMSFKTCLSSSNWRDKLFLQCAHEIAVAIAERPFLPAVLSKVWSPIWPWTFGASQLRADLKPEDKTFLLSYSECNLGKCWDLYKLVPKLSWGSFQCMHSEPVGKHPHLGAG